MNAKRLPADISAWPKDPLAVLGISRGVDRANLRRAYAALLREFNPEHYPEHFRRIRESYEIVLRQVEWSESLSSRNEDAPPDSAPFEFKPELEDGLIEESADAPAAPLDKPAANQVVRPAAAISRWHDDLDALWDRAVDRDEGAYRSLVDMESRFNGRRDLCLRLYWLLVAWPELDARRTSCDWLSRGLRLGGLSGPLAELYRRELEDQPNECLSERCRALLDCEAEPPPLADFVEARWRAAGRLDQFELILTDLEGLRARFHQAAEEIWGRLVLSAINELCWSLSPEIQALVDAYWRELNEMSHLHTRLQTLLDRTETIRAVAVGWSELHGVNDMKDLLQLVRLYVLRPHDVAAPAALESLHRLRTKDRRLLSLFDRIYEGSPAILAQLGQIIALCGGADPTQPCNDADQIRALARFEIESHYRNSYESLRPSLLRFCVREQVSPETLLRMPNLVLVWPDSANTALIRSITADASLQLVYLVHRALDG